MEYMGFPVPFRYEKPLAAPYECRHLLPHLRREIRRANGKHLTVGRTQHTDRDQRHRIFRDAREHERGDQGVERAAQHAAHAHQEKELREMIRVRPVRTAPVEPGSTNT